MCTEKHVSLCFFLLTMGRNFFRKCSAGRQHTMWSGSDKKRHSWSVAEEAIKLCLDKLYVGLQLIIAVWWLSDSITLGERNPTIRLFREMGRGREKGGLWHAQRWERSPTPTKSFGCNKHLQQPFGCSWHCRVLRSHSDGMEQRTNDGCNKL